MSTLPEGSYYLPLPKVEWNGFCDSRSYILFDSEGEVAFFATVTGIEFVHPAWEHHSQSFRSLAQEAWMDRAANFLNISTNAGKAMPVHVELK